MRCTVLILLTFLTGLAAPCAVAAEVRPLVTDFRITSWSSADGVNLGRVWAIAQDEDGYVWIAADAGLVRFDGFRFSRTELVAGGGSLPQIPARTIHRARNGSLWVGYSAGRGVYRISNGRVRNVGLENEIIGSVNAVAESHDSAIWVGHDRGLHRFGGERWERVGLPSGDRVFDVHEDRARALWVATTSGLYRQPAGGVFEKVPYINSVVRGISEDSTGVVWITDISGAFRRAGDPSPNTLFEGRGSTVYHDSRGDLWVATVGQGLWTVHGIGDRAYGPIVRRATVETGLLSDETGAVFEDRDHNIWVGSSQGLHRLTPHRFMGLADVGVAQSVSIAPHVVWVGTAGGLTAVTRTTSTSTTKRLVSSLAVRTMHTNADGIVWAATDEGLYRIDGFAFEPAEYSGPPLRRITSLASDRHGALWICDEIAGLVRLVDGRATPVMIQPDGIASRPSVVHVDPGDNVWVAFEGGGVRTIHPNGPMSSYGPSEGLPHTVISAIHHDRRGQLWVMGNSGVSALREDRFQTLGAPNGLVNRPIMAMLDDDAGDLWLAVPLIGIAHIQRVDTERALHNPSFRVPYRLHESWAGPAGPPAPFMPSTNRRRPNAALAADGTMWFVSTRGVTIVDPSKFRTLAATVHVPRIEGVSADGGRYVATGGMMLPARTSRLRIDYTVVNVSSPAGIRFRYRLDGFDKDWVDGTMARQATYTNLSPGSYRFRVQAATDTGVWADGETAWGFTIDPMFYQTRWFAAGVVLAFGLSAVGAWRLRLRRVRRELALIHDERMRMTHEIHDTLMQGLYSVALQLDAITPLIGEPASPVHARIQRVRRRIEEHIAEAREAILLLRSTRSEKRNIVEALRDAGERLAAGKIPLVFAVDGTPRPCPSKVTTHALRIGQEAILNAVRHSEARRLDVEVRFEDRLLRVRVADDGRGLDAAPTRCNGRTAHYGLMTMKERAASAGGRCTITSAPGSGVEVVAEFPLAPTG